MRARTPIYAFNGGELSRRMEGRSDLDGIYDRGTGLMLNFVPSVEGPAMKRPGFRYVREAAATAGWVSRFVFNTTQAYTFEWSDGKVRFFTNGGRIETAPGVPYELAVPYTAEEAPRISIKQSYDRLYLAHPNHPPAMITRVGAEEFAFAVIPLKNGPFKDFNTDESKTITWAGSGVIGGTATITAPAGTFNAAMVGSPFIFEVKGFSNIKAWEPQVRTTLSGGTLAVGQKRRSNGKVYQCSSLGGNEYTGTIEPTHNSGIEWDGSGDVIAGTVNDNGGVQWEYLYDRFGIGTIATVISATQATITVTRTLPDLDTPTFRYALGWCSNYEGWPNLVDVWSQRLILWKGVDIAGSVTGDYFNMAPLDPSGIFAPDMAFRRRLDVSDPPLWSIADKEYLLAGSASQEIVVSQINRSAGVSADNIRGDPQSAYGSSLVWPLSIGTALLFAQRGGRKIREAAFTDTGRFDGGNINIYARQITKSGVTWLAFQQEPETLLWIGRADGTLAAHPHNPEQQTKGFARVELGAGAQLCGVAIPSDDGQRDELWILAKLGGQKAILKMADWWDEDAGLDIADAFFVDWGVSYDAAELDELGAPLGPRQTFSSGLSHLEGLAVRVLADGIEINDLVVTGGSITLPFQASKVHIGIGYQAKIQLLRAEARGVAPINGLRKRLVRLMARLIDTASLIVRNRRGETDRFLNRSNALPMNAPAPLHNGDTDRISVGTGSDYDNSDTIENDDAYPCMISMLLPEYDVEELEQ